MKLRTKFLITFLSLNLGVSILLVLIISEQFSKTIQEDFLLEAQTEHASKINQIETFLKSYSNRVLLIASLPITETFLNIDPTTPEKQQLETQLTKLFTSIMENDPLIFQARFIDQFGKEQVRIDNNDKIFVVPEHQLQDKSTRPYFVNTMLLDAGDVHVSNIELNEENNMVEFPYKPTIRFSTPLIDDMGQKQGIIIINVQMAQEFQKISQTKRGSIILIDESGEIKLHEDESKLFGSQLKTDYNYLLERPTLEQNLLESESLLYFDPDYLEYRVWTKIYYDQIQSDKFWVLIDRITQDELNQPIFEMQYTIFIISSIIGVATVVLTVIISTKLTRNLTELQNFVIKMSKGELDSKLKIQSNDEIGDLAEASKRMQESLKQYRIMVNSIEKELKRKIEELKLANERKDEFSAMVTHELKTPIFPIVGYCKMLKNLMLGQLTKEQLEAIDIISKNAKQLETLIQDIMDARKLDLEKMRFNLEPVNLGEFYDNLNTSYSFLKDSDVDFVINKPQKNIILIIDKTRLRQVFDNLINNSIKFIPDKNGRIEIGANLEDNNITLFVKDNGTGIPIEKQKNLFRKFYQVDTSERRPVGGTGLGLAISKGILEKLGGSIWVESDGKTGTTFFIKFKLNS